MLLKRMMLALLAFCLLAGCFASAEEDYGMPYFIEVDITNQIVTIYNTSDQSIARQMLCSSGMNGSTPLGTFYLMENGRASERSEWTYFQQYRCWVKYATRIYYGYMFHSLPFEEKDDSTMIAQHAREFGMPTSHGCMRLRVEDAEFIAKRCLVGTRVRIYESGEVNEDLRELLLISSYTGENGMSYKEFMGISEDALGSGSAGDEVLDLQYRLSDLGYYDGEFTGMYDTAVIAAVKHLQADLGLAENGISTAELLELIYSDDAPVSTGEISLGEGKSGPAVKKLQLALQRLGLYAGDIDSVYDLEVSDAVRQFEMICGYDADGVASPEVQRAIYYVINKISTELGSENFSVSTETKEISCARVKAEAKVNVRQYADTESEVIGKLSNGDSVNLVEISGEWAEITANGQSGYVHADYIETYTETSSSVVYTGENGAKCSLGDEANGQTLAQELSEYFANEQFLDYSEESVTFATVDTGSDDLRLNLRAEPSAEGEILAEIPNGTTMRALSQEAEWTKVGYDDQIGYLMNQYLSFHEGGADEVESTATDAELEAEESGEVTAVVVPEGKKKKAKIYDSASENGEVVYSAPRDMEVKVLLVNEQTGWVLVSTDEKEGYMKDTELSFRLM